MSDKAHDGREWPLQTIHDGLGALTEKFRKEGDLVSLFAVEQIHRCVGDWNSELCDTIQEYKEELEALKEQLEDERKTNEDSTTNRSTTT